ncbi:MAG TPA: hypothetical protein VGI96_46730 [Streptosporangiaceae bacterium]
MSKSNRDRQERARERLARIRAEEARRKRRRLWLAGGAGLVVVIAAVLGITLSLGGGGAKAGDKTPKVNLAPISSLGTLKQAPAAGALGPEQVPVPSGTTLASPAASVTGQDVDGISCQTSEQTLFHIHAHLTVFVNGTARQVPAAIGIPGAQAQATAAGPFIEQGKCFYWLHTHAADGIIHIESPVQRNYTLGNFFDEWGQPLSASRVGPASGHVVALYNGQVFQGNPRDIPLTAHGQIQLEVGTPLVAPEKITFPNGL